jgi:hypothetical protein
MFQRHIAAYGLVFLVDVLSIFRLSINALSYVDVYLRLSGGTVFDDLNGVRRVRLTLQLRW